MSDNRTALERWKNFDLSRYRVDTTAQRKQKSTQKHLVENPFYLMEMCLRERVIMSMVFNEYIKNLQQDIQNRKLNVPNK